MNLTELRTLLDSGKFHHATHRDHGCLMEALHVYEKQDNGFNGFNHVGAFSKCLGDDLDAAHEMVRHTGVSVGAYGRG